VKAEVSAVKARNGGHCYIELSQSDGKGLVAKANAIIWASRYRFIAPYFESVTGSPISEGMMILVEVQVNYSQLYGFSLIINDIDPEYSLGIKELERQKTIERLGKEGLMELQKELSLPVLPYRLAVISAEDAAGYRDFMKHLEGNGYGFGFMVKLYPAPMQGVEAPAGIAAALGEIAADMEKGEVFDVVALIRGGGSVLELACFDDYELALNIAQFPLPVFTGIGHDHDFHVADMVAHTFFKTPTAVAAHLIDIHMHQAAVLDSLLQRMKVSLSGKIRDNLNFLDRCADRLRNAALRVVRDEAGKLQLLEYRLKGADPQRVLERGFAIVAAPSGGRVTSVAELREGEGLRLMMMDGEVEVTVKKVILNRQ
jgi:exodeoxyribonuclease VII large subunit